MMIAAGRWQLYLYWMMVGAGMIMGVAIGFSTEEAISDILVEGGW